MRLYTVRSAGNMPQYVVADDHTEATPDATVRFFQNGDPDGGVTIKRCWEICMIADSARGDLVVASAGKTRRKRASARS